MSDLTPILIISHYFPPQGGAGTQRFARFAQWLPHFGYRPIVVTADESMSSPSVPGVDPGLEKEIGKETVVCRVPRDGRGRLSFARRMRLAAGFRTDAEEWVAKALPFALEQAKKYEVEAVITTVSPYAVAEIGREIRKDLDIPWLLDLRDPWALDGWRVYPSIWHARFDRARMLHALRDADVVIANTPEAKRAYVKMLGGDDGRVCTIPNGFEPGDFPKKRAKRGKGDSAFHLVHVGTLHDPGRRGRRDRRLTLRRSWRSIDKRGRSGRTLFEAMAKFQQDAPELARHLRVDLIGRVHPHHQELAAELGIEGGITEYGYLSHEEAVARITRADAVFVPLHGVSEADSALIVPGKLYEAMASGRFVLGGLPEGDGARLLRLACAGEVCDPLDSGRMAQILRRLVEGWEGGSPEYGAEPVDLKPFTRKALTGRLAATLDVILGRGGSFFMDDPWLELTHSLPGELDSGKSGVKGKRIKGRAA